MRISSLLISIIILLAFSYSSVYAESKYAPKGMSGYKYKDTTKPSKEKKEAEKKEEPGKPGEEGKEKTPPLAAKDVLMNMIQSENRQGILDYKVDVLEVTEDPISKKTKSQEKQIYYLAPARILIMQDGFPVSYVDDYLFEKRMADYSVEFTPDETIDGVLCYVVKTAPVEKVFEKNVKYYYVAKDDFRKIRIESTHFNSAGESLTTVTDFSYIQVENKYILPLRSESRTYDKRQLLKETITATFMNWKFNVGLTADFFNEKLKNSQIYDVVK
jgi:hypothetical protein